MIESYTHLFDSALDRFSSDPGEDVDEILQTTVK